MGVSKNSVSMNSYAIDLIPSRLQSAVARVRRRSEIVAKSTGLSKDVIPNQVFIGCPWKTVRKKYVDLREQLKKRFPVHFVIVGSEVGHSAEDLLNFIKSRLETSSSAIFDVSGGNPNVSLEFGYAEGRNIESALYISTHGKSGRSTSSIISDLAGKRRKEYKNEKSLSRLVSEFSKNHPYTIKFEKAMRVLMNRFSKGQKKSFRALSLKIIHYFGDKRDRSAR